ncbi:DUF4249 domain-containing protein [Spirosoma sp. SC4-14]|uniref:DUF4249 domain-containing protein n=1 Tax=Spirosoma sp. SC4-14 TaxID=3128900 RepID=UPI0030D55300
MKTMAPILSFFVGLAWWLLGCGSLRNEVDPSVLGADSSKLVVSGFLSPQDTILAVKLTRSRTVVGDSIGGFSSSDGPAANAGNVVNATVTISDGSRSVSLRYFADGQPYYSASTAFMPIVVGKTYTLTVLTAAGERATSSCMIPGPVALKRITFDSIQAGQNRRYVVRASWQDLLGEPNYYQVLGVFRFITDCSSCANDPGYTEREEFTYLSFDDDNRGVFSDAGIDGSEIISGRSYLNGSTINQQLPFMAQYKKAFVTMNLYNVERSYYQYWSAVVRQRRVRNNPFAEPVLIPGNIQGGLGCFAGYNQSILELKLK